MSSKKSGILDGAFGRLLLPGIVLQSVLIGGGYATGREVVAYGAKFGALGWVAGLAIFVVFTIMAILMFEIARLYKVYNYRSVVKTLIGPFWILLDINYLFLGILVIAVMAAATGSILEATLGLNYWVGVTGIAVLVGVLNFYGGKLIAHFSTYGTIVLYIGYMIFSGLVIVSMRDEIGRVFVTADTSFVESFGLSAIVWSGIVYSCYNLIVYPAALFTVKNQKSLMESIISGVIAGLLMTIPWFLTYFSLMGFYPSTDVLGAEVPWLEMLNGYGTWVIVIFGVVVGWTLIETATGVIHAFMDRVNYHLQESGRQPLSRLSNALVAFGALVAAVILAQVGIIALVAHGYAIMGYGMMVLWGVPMITIGVYKIFIAHKTGYVSDQRGEVEGW